VFVRHLEKMNMLLPLLTLYTSPAHAHAESEGVALHVGYEYDNCYVDLHSELTQAQLGTFGREFMDAGAFLPMAGAESLGAGHVRLGLTYNQTFIDDAEPQWNNTFSHPGDDHWLGRPAIPMIQGRVGLPANLDAELMFTGDPSSNWAVAGAAVRQAVLQQSEVMPLSLAARATYEHLLGPSDVKVDGAALESLVSHRFGPVSPYAGLGLTASLGSEHTNELSLDPAWAWGGRATAGAELDIGFFHAAAQGMWASVPSVAIQVGGTI
jgi:hypothetical protein